MEEPKSATMEGSRIINLHKLQQYITDITMHAAKCGSEMKFHGEIREGLASIFGYSCTGCPYTVKLATSERCWDRKVLGDRKVTSIGNATLLRYGGRRWAYTSTGDYEHAWGASNGQKKLYTCWKGYRWMVTKSVWKIVSWSWTGRKEVSRVERWLSPWSTGNHSDSRWWMVEKVTQALVHRKVGGSHRYRTFLVYEISIVRPVHKEFQFPITNVRRTGIALPLRWKLTSFWKVSRRPRKHMG